MLKKKYFLCLLLINTIALMSNNFNAQVDSTWNEKPELSIHGFADIFYVYDFNQPQGTNRQSFLFNHNRHNEFNLNLGFVKLSLNQTKYRANFALQTGTYANDNYVAEPGLLKNIFEANIGVSLNKNNNLWLDAGILPSHIGFESAISIDNMTLTRSLLAENSPYFLSGVKLTYNPTKKWLIVGLVVNGWQRIQRLEANSLPSFGTQVNYSPSEKMSVNWSTFIGTDYPDSTRRMRYFNNFYSQFKLAKNLAVIAGFDYGMEQKQKGNSVYNIWYSPVIIGEYSINKVWKTALRAEYYQDKTGIIIPTLLGNTFKTTGVSLNIDYLPNKNIMCRLEGRLLNSGSNIFEKKSTLSNSNFFIGTSIAIKFSEAIKNKSN